MSGALAARPRRHVELHPYKLDQLELRILLNYWREKCVTAFMAEDYALWTQACEHLRKLMAPPPKLGRPKGYRSSLRKLTDTQIRRIRQLHGDGVTNIAISRELKIADQTISSVLRGRTYRDVT